MKVWAEPQTIIDTKGAVRRVKALVAKRQRQQLQHEMAAQFIYMFLASPSLSVGMKIFRGSFFES